MLKNDAVGRHHGRGRGRHGWMVTTEVTKRYQNERETEELETEWAKCKKKWEVMK